MKNIDDRLYLIVIICRYLKVIALCYTMLPTFSFIRKMSTYYELSIRISAKSFLFGKPQKTETHFEDKTRYRSIGVYFYGR